MGYANAIGFKKICRLAFSQRRNGSGCSQSFAWRAGFGPFRDWYKIIIRTRFKTKLALSLNIMSRKQKQLDSRHLVLCFQVHQPRRLKKAPLAEGALPDSCLDPGLDRQIMERVASQCYIPTNNLLLKLIEQYPQIKVAFGISGTALEQMELFSPEALRSFKSLAETGSVDFLSEPHYHSLSFLMEGDEFEIQILEHAEKIYEHFGVRPEVFRNTHLIYNDEIGRRISMMGFRGVLIEGNSSRKISPHHLYEHRDKNGLKLLLRNHSLSDDIAFRVAGGDWNVTPDTFFSWLEAMPEAETLVNISLDYETFGEHYPANSGILDFLEHLLLLLAMQNDYRMSTPSEITQHYDAMRSLSLPDYTMVRGCDLSDWFGNDKQREAFGALAELESAVKKHSDSGLLKQWRALQASDHFYYMSDRADGGKLSPYTSSQEAFHYFMQTVQCLERSVKEEASREGTDPEKINEAIEAERRNLSAPVWALTIDPHNGHNN